MKTEKIIISADRYGGIVLPKEILDRFNITKETKFDVEETEDVILLRPVQRKKTRLLKKDN